MSVQWNPSERNKFREANPSLSKQIDKAIANGQNVANHIDSLHPPGSTSRKKVRRKS